MRPRAALRARANFRQKDDSACLEVAKGKFFPAMEAAQNEPPSFDHRLHIKVVCNKQ